MGIWEKLRETTSLGIIMGENTKICQNYNTAMNKK